MDCSTTVSPVLNHHLLELAQPRVHWVGDIILSSPLLSRPPLPSIFPNRVFSYELAPCIRWQKYWSFTFSISPFNEYSVLSSFRVDLFDLPVAQGTLNSLLQHHNLKASILQCSAFFQVSHPCMTTGKAIVLTIWTFVGKMMSLFFNTLFRFVIAFFPMNKVFYFHGCSHHPQWYWSQKK